MRVRGYRERESGETGCEKLGLGLWYGDRGQVSPGSEGGGAATGDQNTAERLTAGPPYYTLTTLIQRDICTICNINTV